MKEEKKSIYRKLVGYTSRGNYWSNGKFAKFLGRRFGFVPPVTVGSMGEFLAEDEANKKISPIGFWIIEELFDNLQDIAYFPHDVYSNIRHYMVNRFRDKLHVLQTKLELGQYYEVDTRLLHGIMETVVNFVETEKAHMYTFNEDDENYIPRGPRGAGLAHLDWEISLGDESPGQSEGAKEVKELYLWWKDVRPARPDPHEASGYDEYMNSFTNGRPSYLMLGDSDGDKDVRKKMHDVMDATTKIEEEYFEEDTEMLVRVIKVRRGMWT